MPEPSMLLPVTHILKHTFTRVLLLVILVQLGSIQTTNAQRDQSQLNRQYNRFQWNRLKWKTFHTKAFHVYFTNGNDSLCAYIVREVPEAMQHIKRRMGTSLLRVPNIIIYPSTSLVYESNIGLYETEPNTLPTFIEKGTRLILAYNGSYEQLKVQLYEALARSIWEAQEQEGIQEQVNKVTHKEAIPFWFKEGAIKYFAQDWPVDQEDALCRSYEHSRFDTWEQCIANQPRLSGQAFCYYLNRQYYPQAVLQLFNQLKKKKNLARAVRLITKKPLDTLLVQCHAFYKSRFTTNIEANKAQTNTITVPYRTGILKNLQLSPDKQQVAYTIFKNNKRSTWLYNISTKETIKLGSYRLPPWINDYSTDNYPLIQWKENGKDLLLVQPTKGKLEITPYLYGRKALSYTVAIADGISTVIPQSNNEYFLAAWHNGQSDILNYNPQTETFKPYTNDNYDDANPALNPQSGQVLFTSKRKGETVPESKQSKGIIDSTKTMQGVYILHKNEKSITVQPVYTDTCSYCTWDNPMWLTTNQVLATSTKYGTSRYFVWDQKQDAQRPPNLLGKYRPIQYHSDDKTISYYSYTCDTLTIESEPLDTWIARNKTLDTTSPWLEDYRKAAAERAKEDSLIRASKDTTNTFLENILLPKNAKDASKRRADSVAKSLEYDHKKVKPYILQLHSAYFAAKINNDYLINRYQPYKGYQGQFKFPELGGMAQGGFTDLFENHHINIAFRLPAGSEGSDFFIKYENTAKKLDWSVAYFRKVESLNADPKRNWVDESGREYPNNAKVKTHYGEIGLSYPLSYYLAAAFTEAIRYDRTIFLATNTYTLRFEDLKSIWSISTLSLNYNKLQPTLPLLYKGYQAKTLIDIFQPLTEGSGTVTGNTIQVQYHQPLYRYITWVSKLQLGYSGGQNKVLYNLGGMDNNITVRVDSNSHPRQNLPYAFQALITPLRGFLQNTLQGNQYLVFNNDVYFPIFQTLVPIETPLSFINNLQLGLFTDMATVNETWNPTNPNNNQWNWSYGPFARTTLAGYPLRIDLAWPGAFAKKPVWYFSLNFR